MTDVGEWREMEGRQTTRDQRECYNNGPRGLCNGEKGRSDNDSKEGWQGTELTSEGHTAVY